MERYQVIQNLIRDVGIYNALPYGHRQKVSATWERYAGYTGLIDRFDRLDENKLHKLSIDIQKLLDHHMTPSAILEVLDTYHPITKFILDRYAEYNQPADTKTKAIQPPTAMRKTMPPTAMRKTIPPTPPPPTAMRKIIPPTTPPPTAMRKTISPTPPPPTAMRKIIPPTPPPPTATRRTTPPTDTKKKVRIIRRTPMNFTWKPNQTDAIQKTLNTVHLNRLDMIVPESGIHCQATGAGKTYIGLKIVNEIFRINNFNKNVSILWFTERKNIIRDQFDPVMRTRLREYGIIDMSMIELLEYIDNKDRFWYKKINQPTAKPKLIIINRIYLTLSEKYNMITDNFPILVIHDECHSATNDQSYKFFKYAKKKWDAAIIGFSATPIKLNQRLQINPTEYNRMKEIFSDDLQNIRIITNYNIVRAIDDRAILPPRFKLYSLLDRSNRSNDRDLMKVNGVATDIRKSDFILVMSELDRNICDQPYKKIIAWTRSIKDSEIWKHLFERYKMIKKNGEYRFKCLNRISSYVDHSQIDDRDINEFKQSESNSILFCVGKHREGSDIDRVDSCIFLDFVKNRSCKEFLQCIGRVLRIFGDKRYGLVMDAVVHDTDQNIREERVVDRIIYYYMTLNNLGSDHETKCLREREYAEIRNNIEMNPNDRMIRINIGKTNKIDVLCNDLDWGRVNHHFNSVLSERHRSTNDTFIYC